MKSRIILPLVAVVLSFSGALIGSAQTPASEMGWSVPDAFVAPLIDSHGNTIGHAAIADADEGVAAVVLLQGLTPGEHGIHLHSVGVCDPALEKPFDSAGSHFNPGEMHHGMHAGDIGNLTVDANGNAVYMFGSTSWSLDDGLFGLADEDGTALVIHESVDDLATDPSGNSGARIACAVLVPPA